MFRDRKDPGEKLAHALEKYRDANALVLVILRRAGETAHHVAKHLNAEILR